MPLGYTAGLELNKFGESYHELKEYERLICISMPSGSGVTLPQAETAEAVEEWNKKNGSNNTKMIIATASQFFNSLERKSNHTKIQF